VETLLKGETLSLEDGLFVAAETEAEPLDKENRFSDGTIESFSLDQCLRSPGLRLMKLR
jgi:hypothetical protein